MFSWLQTNFQKHFRVVFIVLLVVLIIAFVFTIGNQGPIGGGNDRLAELSFFEKDLSSTAKLQKFQQEDPRLSAILSGNFRAAPTYPFERATALHLANQHKVPEPTPEELQAFIKTRPIFQGQNGQFDPQAYTMMIDNFKISGQTTEADLIRVLKEDYRIEKVQDVLRGDFVVSDAEVLDIAQQNATIWTTLVASYPLSQYNPEIEVSEEELKEYFEANQQNYATPTRRIVDYVEFRPLQFTDLVETSEDNLIAYFEDNYEQYQPEQEEPAEGEEASEPDSVTFEDVKDRVEADYVAMRSAEIAYEKANDLVIDLIERDIELGSPALNEELETLGLEKKTTTPFSISETPIGTTWDRNVLQQAFNLTPARYYSEPVQQGPVSTVIFYNSEIESVIPAYETVANAVGNDFRQEQLAQKREAYADELKSQLSEASENEEAFGIAAEKAGFTTQKYSEFSANEPAEGMSNNVLAALASLKPGDVSEPVIDQQENTVTFAYVVEKQIPEIDKTSDEYAQIEQSLREFYGQAIVQQYIAPLMQAELERSGFVAR